MCATENSGPKRDLDFYSLRNQVFPDFVSDQGRAADSIYALMHPYLIKGQIRTIVDFGCGSGEIISAICRKLKFELEFRSKCGSKEVLKLSDYRFVGIDRNASEITEAKAKKCSSFNDEGSTPEPVCGECDSVLFFEEASVDKINDPSWAKENLDAYACREETYSDASAPRGDKAPRSLDWDTCCVILTGHTLPYREVWESIVKWLNESGHKPKFFFFDICTTFDRAIEHLRDKNKHARYTEPLHIEPEADGNEKWFSRDTENIIDDQLHVMRLFCAHQQGQPKTDLFSEQQMKMKACEFIQNLQAIGENKSYFEFRVVERIDYKGGYAPHTGYFCMLRTRDCQVLDQAYCASLENLAKGVLFEQGNAKNSSGFVGNPLYDLKDLKIVTAFLPFDPCYTQMRYLNIALSDGRKTQALNNGRFTSDNVVLDFLPTPPRIVSASTGPKESAARPVFVPAPSLKTAVLMPHSVSNVRSLIQHESFIFANYDKSTQDAIALEAGYDPENGSQNEVKIDKNGSEYFILPIFYGTLPLYCFIFDLGRIPGAYIQQETYDTLLLSIRSLTKSRLSEQVLKQFLVRFASEGLGGLASHKDVSEKALPETLDKAFKMILEKPWYSWTDIIPTKKNKESFVAQAENETLLRLWREALEEAVADPILKGSIWLMEAGFFGDANSTKEDNTNHEMTTRTHLDAADKMAMVAFGSSSWKKVSDSCNTATDWKEKIENTSSKYFSSLHTGATNICVLIWLCQRVTEIVDYHSTGCDMSESCGFAKGGGACKKTKSGGNADLQARVVFAKLKSVFCRTFRNTGSAYRFSLYRIFGFIEMFSSNKRNSYGFAWNVSCSECPKKGDHACDATLRSPIVLAKVDDQKDYLTCDKTLARSVKGDKTDELYDLFKWTLPLTKSLEVAGFGITISADRKTTTFSIKVKTEEVAKSDGDFAAHLKDWAKRNCAGCDTDENLAISFAAEYGPATKSIDISFSIECEALNDKEKSARWVSTDEHTIKVDFKKD